MPRITKSIAQEHLLNTVKRFSELTGQEVGVIIANREGNITAMGKQSFQDYVQERRREIVRVMIRSARDPLIETPNMLEDSVASALDAVPDRCTHTVEHLRRLLTSAIQKSTGGSRIFSRRKRPSWWNLTVPFGNIKSGYSKETLVQLLNDYRNFSPDEPVADLDFANVSVRERSPRRQVSSNQQTESVSPVLVPSSPNSSPNSSQQSNTLPSTPPIAPPASFLDMSQGESSPISSVHVSYDLGLQQCTYLDVANSSQLALELEIEDDDESSLSSVEPFFPRRKSPSELFTPIQRQIQVVSDEETAAALSELSDNRVLLTDVTLHIFMILLRNQFPQLLGLQNLNVGQLEYRPYRRNSIQIHNDASRSHWLVSCADKEGQVSIYDSLFDHTSDQVDVQLAQIYPQSAKFVFLRERMQQQEGATDCGLFAAAVCTSLALRRNPSNTRWDQPRMRDHLARCIRSHHISLFPEIRSNMQLPRMRGMKLMNFKLHCTCNLPETWSRHMIKCNACGIWYHNSCVGFSDDHRVLRGIARIFRCTSCSIIE